jgi:hypothetical protein
VGAGRGLCVTPPPVAAAPMAFGSGVERMMVPGVSGPVCDTNLRERPARKFSGRHP